MDKKSRKNLQINITLVFVLHNIYNHNYHLPPGDFFVLAKGTFWFDLDCRSARQNYRKLKKRFKRITSPQNRLAMIDAEKHYKHTLDIKYKNFRKKFSEDIQHLSKNNPKEFWTLLINGYDIGGQEKELLQLHQI